MRKDGIEASFMDVVTLYAIYRKDIRDTRFLDVKTNNQKKATEKQMQYIKDLAEKKGVELLNKDFRYDDKRRGQQDDRRTALGGKIASFFFIGQSIF